MSEEMTPKTVDMKRNSQARNSLDFPNQALTDTHTIAWCLYATEGRFSQASGRIVSSFLQYSMS